MPTKRQLEARLAETEADRDFAAAAADEGWNAANSLARQTTSLRRRVAQLERDLTQYRDLCMDQMRRNAEQRAEFAALESRPVRVIEGEVLERPPLKAVTA